MNEVEQVRSPDWETWVEGNDAIVLDVREPDEWEKGTLPGATLLSMSELVDRINELDEDKAILCVCQTGVRSQQVANYLAFNGYSTVGNLVGGMHDLGFKN